MKTKFKFNDIQLFATVICVSKKKKNKKMYISYGVFEKKIINLKKFINLKKRKIFYFYKLRFEHKVT